ncbi:MAG: hypothetical protein AB7O62_17825 [Pirellulales bacterium]
MLEHGDQRFLNGDGKQAFVGPTQSVRVIELREAGRDRFVPFDPTLLLRFPGLTKLDLQSPFNINTLRVVGQIHNLEHVCLTGPLSIAPISKRGLDCLRQLTKLQSLEIRHCSDSILEELPPIPTLCILRISGGGSVTSYGLRYLEKFPRLQELTVAGTDLTDAGIYRVVELKHLTLLDIGGTKITDSGMAIVSKLQELTRLQVDFATITDRGVSHLAGCPALEKVVLCKTKITDASVPILEGMPTLEDAWVEGTNITPEGIERLKDHFAKKKSSSKN